MFGIIGIATMLFGFISAINAHKSESWPSVFGHITFAGCGETVGVRTGASAKKIKYEYQVNNKVYQGEREYFGLPVATNNCVAGYIPPQTVAVYYNPNNPENSVLITGQTKQNFFGIFAGLIFLLFAIYVHIKLKDDISKE